MPVLRIKIDDEDTEFRIIPLNLKIDLEIQKRYSTHENGFIILDRAGYLSHIVKEPKMSRGEWSNIPTSLIDKIIRNISSYLDNIDLKERELRNLQMNLEVYEQEVDDLYRYLQEDVEDWVWDRIKIIEKNINVIKEKIDKIEKSLDYVKSDYVVYEKGKDINYEFQEQKLLL